MLASLQRISGCRAGRQLVCLVQTVLFRDSFVAFKVPYRNREGTKAEYVLHFESGIVVPGRTPAISFREQREDAAGCQADHGAEWSRMMQKVLTAVAVVSLMLAAEPAAASLADAGTYTPQLSAQPGLDTGILSGGVENEQVAEVCAPPEAQYIPSFVRDSAGEIVGINYTVIEYVC